MDGERKLGDEDGRKEGDGDNGDDVVDRRNMGEVRISLDRQVVDTKNAVFDVEDGQEEPDTQRHERHGTCYADDGHLDRAANGAADNVDLQQQRAVDGCVDEEVEQFGRDGDVLGTA